MDLVFWTRRTASFLLIGVFILSSALPQGNAKQPSPGLDGIGVDTTCGTHSSYPENGEDCSAQFLNTTRANDVIIVIVRHLAVSIIDSSGLTYNLRIFGAGISEYYAVARTPLRMDNVTVILPHCCALGFQVFAIQGANTEVIFDARPVFPVIVSNCGYSISFGPCSASIEVATHDLVIASAQLNDAGCKSLVSQGFTGVAGNGFLDVEYRIIGHIQHDISFTCPSEAVGMVLDAVSI